MLDQHIKQAEQDVETLATSVQRLEGALAAERQRLERLIGSLETLRAISSNGLELVPTEPPTEPPVEPPAASNGTSEIAPAATEAGEKSPA